MRCTSRFLAFCFTRKRKYTKEKTRKPYSLIAMREKYRKDDVVWKKAFGDTLKEIIVLYSLDYYEFCEKYNVSDATFRYWRSGTKLPQISFMEYIKEFLYQDKLGDADKTSVLQNYVGEFMRLHGAEYAFLTLKRRYPDGKRFAGEILEFYRNVAKHRISIDVLYDVGTMPTGETQAVVFDFDGTLTKNKVNRTTWESIWISLGYTQKDCQELHQRFNRKEISHDEWCKITEDKFKERCLHKESVEDIASKIRLIRGVRNTLKILSDRGIKIYIVSGSIDIIIKKVMGDMSQYIEEIKANLFRFNSAGFLTEIVGTKYDFEGKAHYILQIAEELNIAPNDILFVGNSINDRFAYRSGARTLCVNPVLTDPSDNSVWHQCIQTCENLEEILAYV